MASIFDYMFGNLSDIAAEKGRERRERLGIPEDVEDRKAAHRRRYGDNEVQSIDFMPTLNALTDAYFTEFVRGQSFPPQYKQFLDATKRQGYEIARHETVLKARKAMIEDWKYTNNHYRGDRSISKEGIDILAMCTAYDEFLSYQRRTEDERVRDHRKGYAKANAKRLAEEPIEINGKMADVKKAGKQLAVAEFYAKTKSADDRDVLDDVGDSIKKMFKFW